MKIRPINRFENSGNLLTNNWEIDWKYGSLRFGRTGTKFRTWHGPFVVCWAPRTEVTFRQVWSMKTWMDVTKGLGDQQRRTVHVTRSRVWGGRKEVTEVPEEWRDRRNRLESLRRGPHNLTSSDIRRRRMEREGRLRTDVIWNVSPTKEDVVSIERSETSALRKVVPSGVEEVTRNE